MKSLKRVHLAVLGEALDVAEDATGNFFKFSQGQWKRHFFDVRTGSPFRTGQPDDGVFAVLGRIQRSGRAFEPKGERRDLYFICLQDDEILKALERDKDLSLCPLLTYVFTHELVHIVRFRNFSQRFEATAHQREREERVVHAITHEILRNVAMPDLDYVLEAYSGLRFCDFRAYRG